MLNKKVIKALNDQITKEFYSSYLYLSMAGWFEANDLPGMNRWMRVQTQEESSHAMIIYNYVNELGAQVELGALEKPPFKFKGPKDIFEQALKHEQFITASINSIVDLAIKEKDHATRNFLNWFVDEQVEEESNVNAILGQLKWIKDGGNGILMLDKELGARVFAMPTPLVGKL